jgi:cell division cycle 2-like protein
VALKKVKLDREKEGFPLTALREISLLLRFKHPNVVDVHEVVMGNSLDDCYVVMEFMHHDLRALIDHMSIPFVQSEVKCLMLQLLSAVAFLHEHYVVHRYAAPRRAV